MNPAKKCQSRDPFLGYFMSVAVALLASGWLAGLISGPVAELSDYFSPKSWRANIAAGLFVGIVCANPVGTILARGSAVRSALRLVLGLGIGLAAQVVVIAPFAGDGMSHFLFLMLAVLAAPALLCARRILDVLGRRKIVPKDALADVALRLLRLPDRIMFIILMSASFTVLWRFSLDPGGVLIVLGAALAVITGWVAFAVRKTPDAPDAAQQSMNAWLDLDPEQAVDPSLSEVAAATVKRLARIVLPGAVFLGGVTYLSAVAVLHLNPGMTIASGDPFAALSTLGAVAASGLGLILFGMLALLAFSLSLLFFIGRVRSWSASQFRRHGKILVSMMHFRSSRKA